MSCQDKSFPFARGDLLQRAIVDSTGSAASAMHRFRDGTGGERIRDVLWLLLRTTFGYTVDVEAFVSSRETGAPFS